MWIQGSKEHALGKLLGYKRNQRGPRAPWLCHLGSSHLLDTNGGSPFTGAGSSAGWGHQSWWYHGHILQIEVLQMFKGVADFQNWDSLRMPECRRTFWMNSSLYKRKNRGRGSQVVYAKVSGISQWLRYNWNPRLLAFSPL